MSLALLVGSAEAFTVSAVPRVGTNAVTVQMVYTPERPVLQAGDARTFAPVRGDNAGSWCTEAWHGPPGTPVDSPAAYPPSYQPSFQALHGDNSRGMIVSTNPAARALAPASEDAAKAAWLAARVHPPGALRRPPRPPRVHTPTSGQSCRTVMPPRSPQSTATTVAPGPASASTRRSARPPPSGRPCRTATPPRSPRFTVTTVAPGLASPPGLDPTGPASPSAQFCRTATPPRSPRFTATTVAPGLPSGSTAPTARARRSGRSCRLVMPPPSPPSTATTSTSVGKTPTAVKAVRVRPCGVA